MSTRTRSGEITFPEFMEIIREDQKADLLDGVIYMASPELVDHNELIVWLVTVIGLYANEKKLGALTIHRVAYRFDPKTAPEPDVAVVLAERADVIRRGYIEGAPDLAIELVSPDSVDRDYELKRTLYERAGVREYWIIDPDEERATFLRLTENGFVEIDPDDHIFRSTVLPGLALDVRWFWQRPLPDALPILRSLLGSEKARKRCQERLGKGARKRCQEPESWRG